MNKFYKILIIIIIVVIIILFYNYESFTSVSLPNPINNLPEKYNTSVSELNKQVLFMMDDNNFDINY